MDGLPSGTQISHMVQDLISQIENPGFVAQCGGIVFCLLLSLWITRKYRSRLVNACGAFLPPRWTSSLNERSQLIVWPLICAVLLWLIGIITRVSGHTAPLNAAASELMAAWVVIRLLSLSVKSPFFSVTMSVFIWGIVAFNILGILDEVTKQLGDSAIHLGKYKLSALMVIHAIITLAVLLWLAKQLYRYLARQVNNASTLTPSIKVLFNQMLQIIMPALAIIIALSVAGVDLTGLTVISGAVGLGIGLGLQKLVGNLVAGITILMGKSIKPGDLISYQNGLGQVTEMGARYVTIRKLNGIEYLVPNEYFLENGVENWTHSNSRIWLSIEVGISYDADPRKGMDVCTQAALAAERVCKDPAPYTVIKEFGDNSVNLITFFSIDDPEKSQSRIKGEILIRIWDGLKKAGISIPYPQRDVHIIPAPAGAAGPQAPAGQADIIQPPITN